MASMSVSINLASAFNRLSLSSSFVTGDGGSFYGTARTKLSISCPQKFRLTILAAHKKGAGSTKNGRDSKGQRLGVKIFGDQVAKPGSIIIRQRGTKVHPGKNVGLGKDHTIFSLIDGLVKFEKYGPDKKKVSVYPREVQPENPDSFKVRRREFFRMKRENKKAKISRREGALLAWKQGGEAALLAWKQGTSVATPQLVLASSADENPNC